MNKTVLYTLLATILTATAQIMWKNSAGTLLSVTTLVGYMSYGLASILIIIALRHGALSTVFPLLATSYIWIMLYSYLIFQETITITRGTGVVLITLGVIVLGLGERK